MLKHPDIWRAIDELAEANGFSPSGLAREAGLDATTFNKSKRVGNDGKKRWPSTESIAKILDVTSASFLDFAALVNKTTLKTRLASIQLTVAAKGEHIDEDGQPTGKAWGKQTIAGTDDARAFAIEVNGNTLAPSFRNGSLLVAAPGAKIAKGDRVAYATDNGSLAVREVTRVAGKSYELSPIGSARGAKVTLDRTALRVIAKITQIIE